MSSGKAGTQLEWSFGLRNSAGKYLTAETFQNKIVCAASIMKKKQIFFLEQMEGEDHVFIKSHLGKYLTVDGDGKFLGSGDEAGEEEAMLVEPQADGTWAIKSKKYGWYTGGSGENLTAFTKEISADRLWTIHLAMHPQVNLRNVMRKAYVHLTSASLSTDEIVPWGDDATITVQFFGEDGTYGLVTSNGLYLSNTGALSEEPTDATHFIIEFQGGQVSFKSKANGKYLTALGAAGTLKASKPGITKDEQFVMEDSYPQISLKCKNGKLVSTKQGIELAATGTAVTDEEIFQVEPMGSDDTSAHSGTWALKSCKPKYWVLDGNSVQAANEDSSDASSTFTVEWRGAQVALKASNGKYVVQQMNSYLAAKADEANDENGGLFTYEIVNRPRLVLRGEYGFVGTLPSGLLECTTSVPEVYSMSIADGNCQISHANGKFWKVGSNGVSCTGTAPETYHIELYDNSMLCLKSGDKYFQGAQNGAFTLTGSKPDKSTFFEY
jgi:fascin 1/2